MKTFCQRPHTRVVQQLNPLHTLQDLRIWGPSSRFCQNLKVHSVWIKTKGQHVNLRYLPSKKQPLLPSLRVRDTDGETNRGRYGRPVREHWTKPVTLLSFILYSLCTLQEHNDGNTTKTLSWGYKFERTYYSEHQRKGSGSTATRGGQGFYTPGNR